MYYGGLPVLCILTCVTMDYFQREKQWLNTIDNVQSPQVGSLYQVSRNGAMELMHIHIIH